MLFQKKKNKQPCIRNLDSFRKSGCPQRVWDGEEGCPCWIEMTVPKRNSPQDKVIEKQCLDIWLWKFQWAMLGLLEGNQQAVESFRNGVVEEASDGKVYPKVHPRLRQFIDFLGAQTQIANMKYVGDTHEMES